MVGAVRICIPIILFMTLSLAPSVADAKQQTERKVTLSLGVDAGVFRYNAPGDLDTTKIFGLRLGYDFPWKNHVDGLLLEAVLRHGTTRDGNGEDVRLDQLRLEALYRTPVLQKIEPFLAVGAGRLWMISNGISDVDMTISLGGGLFYPLRDSLLLRVDIRDILPLKSGRKDNWEFTVGLGYVFEQKSEKKAILLPDRGGDGIPDRLNLDAVPPVREEHIERNKRPEPVQNAVDGDESFPEKASLPPAILSEVRFATVPIVEEPALSPAEKHPYFSAVSAVPTLLPARVSQSAATMVSNGAESKDNASAPAAKAMGTKIVEKLESPWFHFDFNRYRLPPAGEKELLAAADQFLQRGSLYFINIEGHTDNVGTEKYNEGLALRRAQAAAAVLVDKGGYDPNRIFVRSHGMSRRVASNATAHGRKLNRRIEVFVLLPAEGD